MHKCVVQGDYMYSFSMYVHHNVLVKEFLRRYLVPVWDLLLFSCKTRSFTETLLTAPRKWKQDHIAA